MSATAETPSVAQMAAEFAKWIDDVNAAVKAVRTAEQAEQCLPPLIRSAEVVLASLRDGLA